MKVKFIFILVAALFFTINGTQAQSFLKKVAQGIEKVGQEIDKVVQEIDSAIEPETTETKEVEAVETVEKPGISEEKIAITETTQPEIPTQLDNVFKKGIHGNVKQITETNVSGGKTTKNIFQFNEHGQITNMELSSYNGNVSQKISYEYFPNGRLKQQISQGNKKSDDQNLLGAPNEIRDISISEQPFDYNISISSYEGLEKQTNHYDNDGTLTHIICLFEDEWNSTKTEKYYFPDGKIAKIISKFGDDIQEQIYDKQGNLISDKLNGEDVTADGWDEDDYNSEKKSTYDAQKRLIQEDGDASVTKYSYNTNNYLTSIVTSDRWWGDASTTYTGYAYDSEGNWIKRSTKKTGEYYGQTGLTVNSSREIIYY